MGVEFYNQRHVEVVILGGSGGMATGDPQYEESP